MDQNTLPDAVGITRPAIQRHGIRCVSASLPTLGCRRNAQSPLAVHLNTPLRRVLGENTCSRMEQWSRTDETAMVSAWIGIDPTGGMDSQRPHPGRPRILEPDSPRQEKAILGILLPPRFCSVARTRSKIHDNRQW